jgi:ectoine hydroxylase-related dioxygenase (phytanoyl-CoA dioxygenase family)
MQSQPNDWRIAYQHDGFVVVPELLDPSTLLQLHEGLDQITRHPEQVSAHLRQHLSFERDHVRNHPHWYPDLTPEQCGNSIRQIAELALFAPRFAHVICYPPLLKVLECLFASPEFSFCLLVGRPKAAYVGNGIQNGHFHRDTPGEALTSANTITVLLCLDAMNPANGSTIFLRGSHRVSDAEARHPVWREVPAERLPPSEQVAVRCPAGAGIFFSSKILHAAPPNRSGSPRRTLLSVWAGPDVLPTAAERSAYHGIRPCSRQPAYAHQVRLTFPHLFPGQGSAEGVAARAT